MDQAPRWQLERYLPLLRLQARQLQRDPRLQRRFDSSDLVQETLARALANLPGFRGTTEAELVAWLQQILARTLIDEIRKATAKMRDLDLEQVPLAVLHQSSARLEAYAAASQPSPSQQAERKEQLLRLAEAIEQLPEAQREVVILRDLDGHSIAEIAAQLGKTEKAVAGLLLRGRRALRERLADSQ